MAICPSRAVDMTRYMPSFTTIFELRNDALAANTAIKANQYGN